MAAAEEAGLVCCRIEIGHVLTCYRQKEMYKLLRDGEDGFLNNDTTEAGSKTCNKNTQRPCSKPRLLIKASKPSLCLSRSTHSIRTYTITTIAG